MKLDKFLSNMKISRKLVAVFLATSVIAMCVNLFIYINLNQALDKINSVFSSNISLNELSDSLNQTHQGLTGYLETKGTDDLELYFASYLNVKQMMRLLNSNVTDNNVKLAERDIREMLDTYLKTADEAVQAKRGRNIDEYTAKYNECPCLFGVVTFKYYSVNLGADRYVDPVCLGIVCGQVLTRHLDIAAIVQGIFAEGLVDLIGKLTGGIFRNIGIKSRVLLVDFLLNLIKILDHLPVVKEPGYSCDKKNENYTRQDRNRYAVSGDLPYHLKLHPPLPEFVFPCAR